ncbi:MAG: type I restriction enzyme HsdR N-terminal domain-containing protein [Chitinophagaceae bacterium]|nr:type I restriction enzyme HsdR N-terminal domain-containing protein [Chitinophagaceae bacterium]
MVTISYPRPDFRIRNEQGIEQIFDPIRKIWLMLTPEEWVRQNFLQYLLQVMKYPSTLVAIEKGILLGEVKKRFDLLVYDNEHRPWMLIECKSMDILLSEETLQQALRYNSSVQVRYIIITNGNDCYAWQKQGNDLELIDRLPAFGS